MVLNFSRAEFLRAASRREDFIRDRMPQIAFAGRSNVGKSSVINCLTGRKNLAYVGSSPGKTTQINYFRLDGRAYLADLPGYGFARVSRTEKDRWGRLMESYFQDEEKLLSLGVLIVDARHAPSADDVTMHNWFRETGCPEIVVANKSDKLRPRELEPAMQLIRQTLGMEEGEPLIPFSAEKKTGRETLIRAIGEKLFE